MIEMLSEKTFEQKGLVTSEFDTTSKLTDTTVELGRIAMNFAQVERVPRYEDGRRESDVEHSFMLALVAPELARTLELPLDMGLVSQFATVHDLIELKTQDVPTLLLDESELEQKEAIEKAALRQLLQELPPYTAHLLERYEHQHEPEARFVRLVDKLLPVVVDIIGQGQRVLQEDYELYSKHDVHAAYSAVHARHVKKFGHEFLALLDVHSELCQRLELGINFEA